MEPAIKIYGERNTNTNYLSKLITLNLQVEQLRGTVPPLIGKCQEIFPGDELLRNLYFAVTQHKNLGWKHTLISEKIYRYTQNYNLQFYLTISKNPYSWLHSLYRNPYHQLSKANSFLEFLENSWQTVSRENADRIVKNPIELWNLKNSSYLKLTGPKTLHLKTEDLFQSPEGVIESIFTQFRLKKRGATFKNLEQSTKNSSKNFSYYQEYYLKERWLENHTPDTIRLINRYLDKNLMSKFGYTIISP